MDEQKKNELTAEADGIIEGRNAVIEALRAGGAIDKIYLQKGETDKTLGHIASKARAAGIVVVEADKRKLDGMSRTHSHQGVIALAAVREYVSVESMLQSAADRGEAPLLVVCDEISDPHNLGAIIRTASYSRMAAAAEAFRESMRPFMGMLTKKSQFSSARRVMPSPSLPMTMAAGPFRSASYSVVFPRAEVPNTHTPCFFRSFSRAGMLGTRATGI